MKRFLVIGIIVILAILMLIVLAIKRTENNTVVDNSTNSVVESTIENNTNTTDEVVSDNKDVDTYRTLLLDKDVYDKDGTWRSSQFAIPSNSEKGINIYYRNDSDDKTIIQLYKVRKWGGDKEIDSFTVAPGDRIVNNSSVKRNASYYIEVSCLYGGNVDGNLRVVTR